MQRRALVLSLLAPFASPLLACGDDSTPNDSNSDGDTDSTSDGMTSLTAGSMSDTADTSATMTNGSMSASDTADSTGVTDTDSTTGVSDTDGTTQGDATQGDTTTAASAESSGSGGETDSGGPGDPPEDPPGVENGLCQPPGEQRWCYSGQPATYNVGQCHPGIQECVQIDLDLGEWGPCVDEGTPSQEECDGIDNDCDGEIDEDLGTTMCGMGICEHEVPNCIDGEEQECDPDEGAMMETCNGIDDDCDGQIDDGLGDQVVECGLGQCEHSVTACEDGEEPECDPFEGATQEVCDGVDNDCDGDVDEGLPDLHCGVGQCEHDVPACINGIPQNCDPFDGASVEVCDGIDNDCDGDVDEDQGNWVCGDFECQVSVPQCIDGVPQPQESCVPEPGGTEICGDGIDNNCDGVDSDCAESFLVGTDNAARPVDVLWMIDSSGSMSEEMATVEANLQSFADTLSASGSSTRLHLFADNGTGSFEICVNPPLGGVNCTENAPSFYHYDTNGPNNGAPFIHSSNALGRLMQQSPTWIPRLQPNSHLAFIVTTDDDGDDPNWVAPEDPEDGFGFDDCTSANFIVNGTTSNYCLWDDPNSANVYTSLAYNWSGRLGFISFMDNFFPNLNHVEDWTFYSIIGETGTTVLGGANDVYEFNACDTTVEAGDEFVKLSLLTDTLPDMFSTCEANWDLSALATDIVNNIPNDTYVLQGSPPGTCGQIDPASIQVVVNGIPMANADWSYDPVTCTLTINNNVPVVGDNVVIIYEIL